MLKVTCYNSLCQLLKALLLGWYVKGMTILHVLVFVLASHTASNYEFCDNIILNQKSIIHIINNQVKFINEIELALNCIYTDLLTKEIVGYGIVIVTIDYFKSKRQI